MNRFLVQAKAVLTMDPARPLVEGGATVVDDGRVAAVLDPAQLREAAAGA
ncbi:MAG: hypothetical protein HZB25_07280, partial [Candidatus Eisenbacteria bacterium]|nr:hypothetical protein [Candidatus Eisenbacteria bacterium]